MLTKPNFFVRIVTVLIGLAFALMPAAQAQVSLGAPRYSSVSGGPDEINLSNLNMELTIPIVQRSGRGIPFSYAMTYDSAFYMISQQSGSAAWAPQSSSMGWNAGGALRRWPMCCQLRYRLQDARVREDSRSASLSIPTLFL